MYFLRDLLKYSICGVAYTVAFVGINNVLLSKIFWDWEHIHLHKNINQLLLRQRKYFQ